MNVAQAFGGKGLAGIVIGTMIVLPLTGCEPNNPETYVYAKKLFDGHRLQFAQLVALLSNCKGAKQIASSRGFNYPAIPNFNVCSNQPLAYRDVIAKKLARLNILWVVPDWRRRPKSGMSRYQFSGASFVISSHGIVNRGSGSAIWYFVRPQTDTSCCKPLTPPPYHWLFNKN